MSKKEELTIEIESMTFGDLIELSEIQEGLGNGKGGMPEMKRMFEFLDRIIVGGIKHIDVSHYQDLLKAVDQAFSAKFADMSGGDEKN